MATDVLRRLFIFLWITSVVPDETPPRYFGTTNDVSIHVTPRAVFDGFTKDLTLSCVFSKQDISHFDTLLALILSKTDSGPDHYTELAAITSVGSDEIETKQSLGAEVTGMITPGNTSFITYTWVWPGQEVAGTYFCEAHGSDMEGHPRMSTASVEVVVKETLDKGVLSETIQDLDSRLTNCSIDNDMRLKSNKKLKSSQEELHKQLDDSNVKAKNLATLLKDTVLFPKSTWREHTYFLSHAVHRDVPTMHYFCILLGGYLVEVDDEDEYVFVTNQIEQLLKGSGITGVFIGTWEEGHEGNWTYIHSERPVTYFNWHPNEPNDMFGGNENCIEISVASKKMNDLRCKSDGVKSFICEIP